MYKFCITAFLVTLSFSAISCRETETKTKEVEVVREVEVPVETETKPDREGILERTAKEVDNEVNKEINQEIDKIGDDN